MSDFGTKFALNSARENQKKKMSANNKECTHVANLSQFGNNQILTLNLPRKC